MKDEIVTATDQALKQVTEPRFLQTERGFHGRSTVLFRRVLEERDLLQNGRILEME